MTHVFLGLPNVKANGLGDFQGEARVGPGVICPSLLVKQYRFQHLLELALLLGRLEQFHHLVGSLVEWCVPNDEPNVIGILRHYVFHNGIKGPARFTSGIEEFDNGDRCALRAKYWGMHTHETGLLGPVSLVLSDLSLSSVETHAQRKRGDHEDQDAADGELLGVHGRVFRK